MNNNKSLNSKGLTSISEILEVCLNRLVSPEQFKLLNLKQDWEDIVGEKMAKELQITRFEKGILFLKTSHPAWKMEFSFQKRTILQLINKWLKSNMPYIRVQSIILE